MNIEELRAQLEQLAGPEPSPTTAAREAVHRRARRARRRTGAVSTIAGVVVVALVAAGVIAAQGSPVKVRTTSSSTAARPAADGCTVSPPIVPAADVPSDVAKWASNAPVVGSGALWAVRSIVFGPALYDSGIYRMKVSWLTRPFGIPTFAGHRVDGPGTFHGNGDQAIDPRGEWVASTLEFSAAGCWAVTVSYRDATIEYQMLVGNHLSDGPAPRPGTITGTLRVEGGPAPGIDHGIAGTVHIDGLTDSWAGSTTSDGTFSATVNAGTYKLTGSTLDGGYCSGGNHVVVTAGQMTHADVICNVN